MVEKPWFGIFIVTCALGLAVVLDFFQLAAHSAIPCLCANVTNRTIARRSSVGGDFKFVQGGIDILKFDKKSIEL